MGIEEPEEYVDPDIEGAVAEVCRRSFARFVREAWSHLPHLANTKLEWNWHHDALCLHLQTMAEEWAAARLDPVHAVQRIKNLAISIAPGTSKTLLTLVFFPAWMWTRWPDWSCRCVSANPRAILESSQSARILVESDWYRRCFVPEDGGEGWAKAYGLRPWELRDDQDAKSDWGNTLGGFRRSTGLKAPVVGEHTAWLLADDLLDANAAHSAAERAAAVAKWDDAIFNRVNDARTACRVVVMQRVHKYDPIGHFLENQADLWAHLVIASEFEPEHTKVTPIGWHDPRTERGELLDYVRFPRHVLDQYKKQLGTAGYNAQHLQRPDAESGQMFPVGWWRFFTMEGDGQTEPDARPKGCSLAAPVMNLTRDRFGVLEVDWVCVSVDATFGSTSETASAVGIIIGAGKGAARFILDDPTNGARSFLQTLDDIVKAVARAVEITNKRQIRVLVEKKANGAACLEMMEKALREGKFEDVHGHPVQVVFEAYEPGQSPKDSRAHAMEPDVEGGILLLHDGAKWLRRFVGEFAGFGGGKMRNDRVDATGQLLARYRKKPTWADVLRQVGR